MGSNNPIRTGIRTQHSTTQPRKIKKRKLENNLDTLASIDSSRSQHRSICDSGVEDDRRSCMRMEQNALTSDAMTDEDIPAAMQTEGTPRGDTSRIDLRLAEVDGTKMESVHHPFEVNKRKSWNTRS